MKALFVYTIFGILSVFGASTSLALWNQVGQFSDPVTCGYFFDRDHGIIGLGDPSPGGFNYVGNSPLAIYYTNNGGRNWIAATIPTKGVGRITSISMLNTTVGYASMFSDRYSLWKTTNGGVSWTDISRGSNELLPCIYATTKAIVRTVWNGANGGPSMDGGVTFNQVFSSGQGYSNGIDFTSDNIGVATCGPKGFFSNGQQVWYTRDGGISWKQGGDIGESWGVYGIKGTETFLALPEGDATRPTATIMKSVNGGQSWKAVYSFGGGLNFTGHIAGVGNTTYVQTTSNVNGLYRSDDAGTTWVPVGGPGNNRDTRFVVTGCRGEVVYAFDNNGGIFKTDDGGNGAFGFLSRLGTIAPAKAGDTTRIPIYLDTTTTVFTINQFSGQLRLNRDLIEPYGFDIVGTLAKDISFDTIYALSDSEVSFLVQFKTPLKNGVPLSKPLIYIVARAYLNDATKSDIFLSSANINSGAALQSLVLCTVTSTTFSLLNECGDSSIRNFMGVGDPPRILSIFPNPAIGDEVTARVYLSKAATLSIDLFDSFGINRSNTSSLFLTSGEHEITLRTKGFASGNYSLRLRTEQGSYSSGRMVITR
ncbi:MAG: hypothetical protein WCH46_01465 [bacterium]